MIPSLFLLFTVVPALELYLLIRIGQWTGPGVSVGLVILAGLLGAWLAKREGLAVLRQVSGDLAKGQIPGDSLVEGAMVLLGSTLLVTPGVVTDLVGFLCILPWTRRRLAPILKKQLAKRIHVQGFTGGPMPESAPSARSRSPNAIPFDHPVR